jgi:hypothetical protein
MAITDLAVAQTHVTVLGVNLSLTPMNIGYKVVLPAVPFSFIAWPLTSHGNSETLITRHRQHHHR